ncbi:efflux transporter outer membrane subunit [Methylobacter svalbardensis]|uniref:efflux transporter outer membrane subunit n=1 Tax=Methylobacter svalbardensis TaxID=3080016 RepID=UPI0030EF8F89
MTYTKLILLLLLPLTTACSVDVKDVPTPVNLPEKFSVTGQTKTPNQWWLAFNDAELNRLIDQALNENFTLLAAFNRLEQARAVAKKSGAELIPEINGSFGAAQKNTNTPALNNFTLGLAASYELDLWGRIRANIHATELDSQVAEEDVASAAISVSAEIASSWYKLVEQRQQLKLLDSQIKVNRDNVSMVTTRFRLGQATAADVFQQSQLLEFVIGSQLSVIANIRVLENQLAILIGKSPGTVVIPEQGNFPALPPIPETGLSADLMQRRPDLRKAYFRIQAADQRIASAIADRFPKLSLSAGIDTSSPDLQSLFNNWMATIAGNLVMPLIDGGRRIAEVERNQAVAAEAVNNYATALLNAVKEVENALIQEHQQYQLALNLDRQVQLSQQASAQIRSRYIYGAMDFLRVLSALLSQQSLERNSLLAQQQLIDYRINLYRALASGRN